MDIYKLLIVGEAKTGKTQLITSFLSADSKFERESRRTNVKATFLSHQNTIHVRHPSPSTKNKSTMQTENREGSQQNNRDQNNVMMDFVMKIIEVDDRKVRVQLWEIAGGSNAQYAFAPLFIRNAVGCIMVANADNPKTLKEMAKWKSKFDESTSLPGQQCLPSAIFVNHFTKEDSNIESILIQEPVEVKPKLRALCSEIQDSLKIPIYHMNALTMENILESFQQFMSVVIKHQESTNQSDILDDLVSQDQSLKFDNSIKGGNNKTSARTGVANDKRLLNSPLSNTRYNQGRGGHISGYDRQSLQLTNKVEKQHQSKKKQNSCAC